ncbi:MAG TPA: hypothetical protein VGI19_15475 [Candidatus Cybelea sp.]|jgi:hypothetical protein
MSNQKLGVAALTVAAALPFVVTAGTPASAAGLPNIHVRGTISNVTASSLTVATSRGAVTLALAPQTKILQATRASRSDIKPNSFVGVANVPGANNAQAVGVLLLPDAFRNGPANAGWDWPGAGSGSNMTNGTVQLASHMTNGTVRPVSHMTNGTVSPASGNGPYTVTLNYTSQSGSELVTIPANAPVVRLAFSNQSALKAGSHLFIFAANNNGQLGAAIVVVGAPGVTPPM